MGTRKLEKIILMASTRRAAAALTANLLVTLDLTADAEGGQVKPIGALAQVPFGAVEDSCASGRDCGVVEAGVIPITCVDASIAAGVVVYNDVAGKVSATQGAGATKVGTTRSSTTAANQLVAVKLAI